MADEDIPEGTVIWEPDEQESQEISQNEFGQKTDKDKKEILYFGYRSKNTGNYYLSKGDIHFINHSEDGNATEKIMPNRSEGVMFAKRDIKKGEEITQDYREFESEEDTKKRGISLG